MLLFSAIIALIYVTITKVSLYVEITAKKHPVIKNTFIDELPKLFGRRAIAADDIQFNSIQFNSIQFNLFAI